MLTCPACGTAAAEDARYCTACGRGLPRPEDDETPADGPPEADDTDAHDETDLSMPLADRTTVMDVELVTCPACGASNAVRRRRCGRCGQPLRQGEPDTDGDAGDTSVALPTTPPSRQDPDPDTPTPAGAPSPRPRPRRRLPITIVAIGVLLGAALGVTAGLGLGPFAGRRGPVATFDPVAYPDAPAPLPQVNPVASRTRPPANGRTFAPDAAVDGDIRTAWSAAVEPGAPRLQTRFLTPAWVRRVEIANGDQHDEAAFAATARPLQVRIRFGDALVVDATLLDRRGVQVVDLGPQPVLTDDVTVEVVAQAGEGPIAISELSYVGWAADAEDRAAFEANRG